MVDMKGRLCIVTGANSGIGYYTVRGLAEMNATVVLVCRDLEKGRNALKEIKEVTGSNSLYLMYCDISSMKSIDKFTREFQDRFTCLNVLINNAGAAFSKRQETEEGYEKTIATNYLGIFKLNHNMLQMLLKKPPSRIINISSGMHKTGKVDFDDLMFEKRYKSMEAYATTKLMLTTYTYSLAKHLMGTKITANMVEPGFVATNLGANMGGFWDRLAFTIVRPMQISAEKGAETSIWAASNPTLEEITGKTFAKKAVRESAKITYDNEFQKRLWEKTAKILDLEQRL
jgi:NAD(P)-dependent dehydrogenase (short-subunit alcohol dehydrogenase family)